MLTSTVYQKTSRHVDGFVHVHRDELMRMFHLPLAEAACKIGLCSTTFKKLCRRLGIETWPYQKQTKRRIAYKYAHIATKVTSMREQSLYAPADQDHDSATNNAWSSTASDFPFLSTDGGGPERACAGVPAGAQRSLSPCIEAVMDYLDACEVEGHSGFLFLLEDEDHDA
jgi:hypothetical protein